MLTYNFLFCVDPFPSDTDVAHSCSGGAVTADSLVAVISVAVIALAIHYFKNGNQFHFHQRSGGAHVVCSIRSLFLWILGYRFHAHGGVIITHKPASSGATVAMPIGGSRLC
jgi:hypothetical protein